VGIGIALLYGLIQGVTEFLPISSSGHLAIAHILGLAELDAELRNAFNVFLHLASLLAIAIAFRREIAAACRRSWRFHRCLLVAIVPTAAFGLLCRDVIEAFNDRLYLVGIAYLWTAGLLVFAQVRARPDPDRDAGTEPAPPAVDLSRVTFVQAVLVGLLQSPSLLAGISRSGSTVAAGLLGRMTPQLAVAFSFLVGLPLIAGASGLYAARGDFGALWGQVGPVSLVASFVACFLVSWGSIWLLKLVVARRGLHWFALYCAVLGACCIAWDIWGG
jgi:undecaprenyl-diphosphatase